MKLASIFFAKMQEHIDNNFIPKDVPAFAKSFFVVASGGGGLFLHHRLLKLPSLPPISLSMRTAGESVKATAKVSSRPKVRRKKGTLPTRV
jgi:hypothetical protein